MMELNRESAPELDPDYDIECMYCRRPNAEHYGASRICYSRRPTSSGDPGELAGTQFTIAPRNMPKPTPESAPKITYHAMRPPTAAEIARGQELATQHGLLEPSAPAGEVELKHGMNCPALTPGNDEDCVCGLHWRVQLQTEREMHNAWRKRAEEAESERDEWETHAGNRVDRIRRLEADLAKLSAPQQPVEGGTLTGKLEALLLFTEDALNKRNWNTVWAVKGLVRSLLDASTAGKVE